MYNRTVLFRFGCSGDLLWTSKVTIHDRTIYLLQRDYPGSKTVGFRKAVQRLQWDWENWADAEPTEHGESKPAWSDFLEYGEVEEWDHSRSLVH
jgi:hypothetical protein